MRRGTRRVRRRVKCCEPGKLKQMQCGPSSAAVGLWQGLVLVHIRSGQAAACVEAQIRMWRKMHQPFPPVGFTHDAIHLCIAPGVFNMDLDFPMRGSVQESRPFPMLRPVSCPGLLQGSRLR